MDSMKFTRPFRRAIRHSMLINPKGVEGKYRAVDWALELDNLSTKVSVVKRTSA